MVYLKKTLSLILVFAMLSSILPWTVSAEETEPTQEDIAAEHLAETLCLDSDSLIISSEASEETTENNLDAIPVQDNEGDILPEDLSGDKGEALLEAIDGVVLPVQPEVLQDELQINELIISGSVMDEAYPDVPAAACSLSELTSVDYLAFSTLAYLDFDLYAYAFESNYEIVGSYITVQDALVNMGLWNATWSQQQNITYAQLCEHIAGWRVLTYHNHSNQFGFYAVAFQNENQEAVIAYRGSIPPDKINIRNTGWDAIQDWLVYDFNAQIDKKITKREQYDAAFETYRKILNSGRSASKIAVTGHSLGGGLATLVAARYGCACESINAISVLDTMYYEDPIAMGENFAGINRWSFLDHVNMYDVAAGMYEKYFGVEIKPYSSHYNTVPNVVLNHNVSTELTSPFLKLSAIAGCMLYCPELADCHSMDSIVYLDSNNKVIMTGEHSNFRQVTGKTSNLDMNRAVDFGWSGSDEFSFQFLNDRTRTMLGGDGNDYLTATIGEDKFVGGKGDDTLCGGSDDDTYIYFKGDGYDTIQDTDGSDRLYMYNFSSSDGITVVTDKDYDYVYVKLGSSDLVRIAKKGRKASFNDRFEIIIEDTDGTLSTHDISSAFHYKDFWAYLDVGCPVNVEILDAEGNVVFTVEDGAVGYHITDYGNFYVYNEEDGSFGKHLELVTGYTARIVGNDTGTMDIAYAPITADGMSEINQITDVPVSAEFTADVILEETGEATLEMDTDGDGTTDMITEITNPCGENLTWIFDEATGTLTIKGEGAMFDYAESNTPWHDFSADITNVIIEAGVTSIGSNAFADCTAIASIRFNSDAPVISDTAFTNVNATAFYPAGNETWTEAVLQNYGGTIAWENICYDQHTIITDEEVAPTCTNTGLTEGKHCSLCNTVIVAQESIPAKGHTEVLDPAVAATCTETGLTEGKHCSVCNEVLTLQLTVPVLGHTEVVDAEVSATCTKTGLTEGKHCSVCNEVLVKQETVPVTDHTWIAADCDTPKTCSVCKATEGKATGHSYNDNIDGTCNACSIQRETVETRQVTHMFRMYNPNTGEHFYTGSEVERQNLVDVGWQYEGVGFTFPANTGAPVHRLFEPDSGEHLYTMDEAEKDKLMAEGWNYEGIAFNSAYDTEAVQHRLHNPNATVGAYHFTFSEEEMNNLIAAGWEYQGIGWYSCWK